MIRLDFFGSAATGAFCEEDSDLDFIAVFADPRAPGYADRFLGFADALENRFGRSVEAARQPVYERRDEEAVA